MACTEAARGESESYRCESAESADCEGLKLVPGDRHGRGRATAGACCNSAGPGVLLRTPHSLPLLFCVVFRSMRFPGLAFLSLVPSIPLGLCPRRAKNRDVPTPRTPVPGRPGIRLAIRLLRGAETPERLERPRPAARRRNGPGPGDDATGPRSMSTEACPGRGQKVIIQRERYTIVIPLLTSQRSAHSSGPG